MDKAELFDALALMPTHILANVVPEVVEVKG